MKKILVITGSSREKGNGELLLNYAIQEQKHEVVLLRNHKIYSIEDKRHSDSPFENKGDDYYDIINKMISSDEIIFVTPIYWYNISGLMKNFIDRWTESLRATTFNFKEEMKNKTIYVIVVGANSDKTKANSIIEQFKLIANYFSLTFGGAVVGTGDKPGDILNDIEAIEKAKKLLIK